MDTPRADILEKLNQGFVMRVGPNKGTFWLFDPNSTAGFEIPVGAEEGNRLINEGVVTEAIPELPEGIKTYRLSSK